MTLASLAPNRVIEAKIIRVIIVGQIGIVCFAWAFLTPTIIPKPWEVFAALQDLWSSGFVADLYTSLILFLQSLGLATLTSLLITYAATFEYLRPPAEMWAKLRFLGMTGMPFIFTVYFSGAHELKLLMLSFFVSVFLVTSMLDVIDATPKEKFDLARTLRMNDWQVLFEVQVLGRTDLMFDAVRQNAAIGWMMLGSIEAIWKVEGGVGVRLDIQQKHFGLDQVLAMQLMILLIGIFQDYMIGIIKQICCPYAKLLLERK